MRIFGSLVVPCWANRPLEDTELMASFTSGEELSAEDKVKWAFVDVNKGNVVEVSLADSSLEPAGTGYAGFVVLHTMTELDTTLRLWVKFLGAEDAAFNEPLMEKFGEKGGVLCLRQKKADVELEESGLYTLYVTKARFWTLDDFQKSDYLNQQRLAMVSGWLEEAVPPEFMAMPRKKTPTEKGPPEEKEKKPGRGVQRPKAPAKKRAAKQAARPPKGGDPPGDVATEGKPTGEMTAEMRKKLRDRLKQAKDRVGGGGKRRETKETEPAEEVLESGSETVSSGYVPDDSGLNTGSAIIPRPPTMALDEKEKKRSKKDKKRRETTHDELVEIFEEDTNATSSKNWSGQLVQQAVRAAKSRGSKKKKTKTSDRKKSAATKLTEAITTLLGDSSGGGSGKKDKKDSKKKKKKKKKKRKIRRDGTIESYSVSSSSPSSSPEMTESSSDEDLETPIRKKSRTSPGSILAMLTNHVREQLEQSAMVDLNPAESTVTGGVKILTYFTLQLKPAFATHLRELRELHHLAMTMDTLRKGDIARTGDSLAARFMAIHQSLLDQNWSAAKHLELFPMEDASAATSGVILATRKHSRLVAKMQGLPTNGNWWSYGRGRGKGNKNDWNAYGDGKGDPKGKKGGKKGDPKGKGRGGKDKTNEWKDSKEKEAEK